jgi:hypothetical protein
MASAVFVLYVQPEVFQPEAKQAVTKTGPKEVSSCWLQLAVLRVCLHLSQAYTLKCMHCICARLPLHAWHQFKHIAPTCVRSCAYLSPACNLAAAVIHVSTAWALMARSFDMLGAATNTADSYASLSAALPFRVLERS